MCVSWSGEDGIEGRTYVIISRFKGHFVAEPRQTGYGIVEQGCAVGRKCECQSHHCVGYRVYSTTPYRVQYIRPFVPPPCLYASSVLLAVMPVRLSVLCYTTVTIYSRCIYCMYGAGVER